MSREVADAIVSIAHGTSIPPHQLSDLMITAAKSGTTPDELLEAAGRNPA